MSDATPDDEAPELPEAAYHDPADMEPRDLSDDRTDFFLVGREGVDLW